MHVSTVIAWFEWIDKHFRSIFCIFNLCCFSYFINFRIFYEIEFFAIFIQWFDSTPTELLNLTRDSLNAFIIPSNYNNFSCFLSVYVCLDGWYIENGEHGEGWLVAGDIVHMNMNEIAIDKNARNCKLRIKLISIKTIPHLLFSEIKLDFKHSTKKGIFSYKRICKA